MDDEYWVTGEPYDYFLDIEYGANEYYDVNLRPKRRESSLKAGSKRKAESNTLTANKRQKTGVWGSNTTTGQNKKIYTGPNVVLTPCRKLYELSDPCEACGKLKPYALLPEWKQFLRDNPPPALRQASQRDSMLEESLESQSVDPSQLLSILQKGLGSLPGGSAAKDMQAILMELLSNGAELDMDEILEKLTSSVVSQVAKGGTDSQMGKWLAKNGVSLQEGSEDGESVASQSVADGEDLEYDGAVEADDPPEQTKGSPPDIRSKHKPPSTQARKGRSTKATSARQEPEREDSAEALPPKKMPAPAKGRKRKVEDEEDLSSRKIARPDETVTEEPPPIKRVTRSTRARK